MQQRLTQRFWFVRLPVAAIVLWVAACASRPAVQYEPGPGIEQAPSPIATPTDGSAAHEGRYPAFPPGPGRNTVPKRTSAAAQLDGSQWTQQFGAGNRAGAEPSAYVILPGGEDDLAWAVYSVSELVSERPVDLSIAVAASPMLPGGEDDLPLSYWIGLSDYTSYRWEWQGPYDTPRSFSLNSEKALDRYVSANGTFSFVVLCDASLVPPTPQNPQGLCAAEINAATAALLDTSDTAYLSTSPHFARFDQVVVGGAAAMSAHGTRAASALQPEQYVELDWTHIFDMGDPDCEAFGYRLYRQGESDASRIPIGDGDPGGIYVDPLDNYKGVAPPVPGESYQYFIRANNDSGWTPFYAVSGVTIPLLPPANLSASDGTLLDRVALSWDPCDGAAEYLVYRDDQGAVIATVTAAQYDDLAVADYAAHTYWIKARAAGGVESDFSASDAGHRGALPVAALAADDTAGAAPLTVNFDASLSSDPDGGTIALFQWDVDDDGTYDINSGTEPTAQVDYTVTGVHVCRVRVIDDEGQSATDTLTITVSNPPPDLVVVPSEIGPGRKSVRLLFADPLVRRNPRVNIDVIGGSITPLDMQAFSDQLKTSGSEFVIQVTPPQVFPRVTVVESPTPGVIDALTAGLPGVVLVEINPHRIVLDLAALPDADAGTPLLQFAFRLFDKDDQAVGQGVFDSVFPLPDPQSLNGIDYGVNAFNRTSGDLSTRDYSNKSVEGSTVGAFTPDVLWFEFTGGWMYDVDEFVPGNNVKVVLTRQADSVERAWDLELRVAGLGGSQETYLSIRPLVVSDFAGHGMGGILLPGQSYSVALDDPATGPLDFTYADNLIVVSDAP